MNDAQVGTRMEVKDGYECVGRVGTVLGEPVMRGGQAWTPIAWDDADDPDWFKTVGLKPEVVSHVHHVTIVVQSKLAYHETMSELVSLARTKFPGPIEAHGIDPRKLADELACVLEERNTAVVEMHKMRCEMEAAQRRETREALRRETEAARRKRKRS